VLKARDGGSSRSDENHVNGRGAAKYRIGELPLRAFLAVLKRAFGSRLDQLGILPGRIKRAKQLGCYRERIGRLSRRIGFRRRPSGLNFSTKDNPKRPVRRVYCYISICYDIRRAGDAWPSSQKKASGDH
jgi:hypothetical protein